MDGLNVVLGGNKEEILTLIQLEQADMGLLLILTLVKICANN